MKLTDLPIERQREVYNNVSMRTGLPPVSIEKDWWVTQTLRALFALPYFDHLSFKGGTSLSKCWGLIERFSEDIDLAVDREYLGYSGELSKTQISDKLRRAACSFVRENMCVDLYNELLAQGVRDESFVVSVNITPVTTTDPEIIFVKYKSVFPELKDSYLPPVVKVEISGRSMSEPIETKVIRSVVDEQYPNSQFSESEFSVRAVLPERTFLEKVFLLHEELCKQDVRVDRMSRHIYDVVRMMDAGIYKNAINDKCLYRQVVEHRRKFVGLKGFDYDTLYPKMLCIIPGEKINELWRADYKTMCEQMIWGDAPSYDELIAKLRRLNDMIGELFW